MNTESVLQLVDPGEFARCLFVESNDALLLFDPASLQLVDANPSAQRLIGLRRGELLERSIPQIFVADDEDLLNELYESCRRTKLFHSRESYQLVRHQGESIDVNVTLSRLQVQPRSVGVISIRDVRDRRQLESKLRSTQSLLMATIDNQAANLEAATAELQDSQRRLQELVDDVNAIVWEAELPDLRFTYVSNRAVPIFGYPVEQWLQEPRFWINHLHPEDIETASSQYREAIREERDLEFDYRAVTADGRVIWIRNTLHLVKDEKGRSAKVRGVMTDITSRVEAKQQLASRERELAHASRLSTLGAMVAGIAHEVNQPLAAISNFASAAQRELESSGVAADSPLAEWMNQIGEQAFRCGDIIRGLRRFTRKASDQYQSVEMTGVIRDSITVLNSMLRQHAVNLQIDLPSQPLLVQGNAAELQQVMVNLISNACESVRDADVDQPSVWVQCQIENERLIISVVDNGPGIDSDAMQGIFDPFFSTRAEGLGIGLAISRTIVENHGGQLVLLAEHTPGACFRFDLPRKDSGADP